MQLTLDEYLQLPLIPPPEISVEIAGGVLVYCDPDTYPLVFPDLKKWKIAIGLHPKAAPFFNNEQFEVLRENLTDVRVAALGEVGLDRTCNRLHWTSQEKVLDRILSLATPNKPIILHVRGQNEETMSEATYNTVFDIVSSRCEPEQQIHLHCFHGSAHTVRKWRTAFPNTYFSFSLKVKEFHAEQKDALLTVPAHRLLLETDSPYFTTNTQETRVNNPRRIGQVALIVAGLRSQPVAEILAVTMANGRSLYG